MKSCDFLIVGAGIVGVSVARELTRKHPGSKVIIIDKEPSPGMHGSGRNSGVIHAGFYYSPDSLKAKLTRKGNIALTQYCDENNLPILKCGKLVIAQNETELSALDELYRRGQANDVPLKMVDQKEAKEIEPTVRTYQRAIWSPTTSSAFPVIVLNSLIKDCQNSGVEFLWDNPFLGKKENGNSLEVLTPSGTISAKYLVNCGGLYADQIAKSFDCSKDYVILPFKGLYLYQQTQSEQPLRTNIYPVPNLNNPFLGVHYTLTVDGKIKIGPTAIPAFWREQYNFTNRFSLREFLDIISRQLGLLIGGNKQFRTIAKSEIKKYFKNELLKQSEPLRDHISLSSSDWKWGKPGIRAQLFKVKEKTLEMDFIIENGPRSTHVLNAVSPGWTCSLPFAEMVVSKVNSNL